MIRKILDVKDPRLRKKSVKVSAIDKKIQDVIKDLKDTIGAQVDPEGVGLAAPQIGKNLQIFLVKPQDSALIVINPQVVEGAPNGQVVKGKVRSGKKILEGCLSLPHYYGPLERRDKITIKYLDENGIQTLKSFTGLDAQIIQHEIDHLNGELFIDRLLEQKKPLYEYKDGEWEEVEL